MTREVPSIRVRTLQDRPENPLARYVLYWMIAARRTRYNFALEHAANRAEALGLPLLILEALAANYPWSSERFHRFILCGMRDNQAALAEGPVHYYPYVESEAGASKGLLHALSKEAALVVSDDAPQPFLVQALRRGAEQSQARFEVVEGNGIYPIYATDRVFTTAASFRRHLQKELPDHLAVVPRKNPLARRKLKTLRSLPAAITKRWPRLPADPERWTLRDLHFDHPVAPVQQEGGAKAAGQALQHFLRSAFPSYLDLRNEPEAECQSFLSSYLHFGHISAHEVFLEILRLEAWSPERLAPRATGSRAGWWGASQPAEAFLDQLITWRELGHNMAALDPNYQKFASLPAWAQTTLEIHTADAREHLYSLAEFEAAQTHDPLWNAAQTQLLREGTIHNYLRMLWGKKILEWTASPQEALQIMIELNNKYALDGRDPNSYSGIFWILGRYDRAWGPEREIFGKVRYMSSQNTARKWKTKAYVERYRAH